GRPVKPRRYSDAWPTGHGDRLESNPVARRLSGCGVGGRPDRDAGSRRRSGWGTANRARTEDWSIAGVASALLLVAVMAQLIEDLSNWRRSRIRMECARPRRPGASSGACAS